MGDDPNQSGNSRRWIVQEVENSLRRLGTDWIDLYQIHRPEPGTDIDETLGALSDLVHAGKIRYFGSSTFPAHADRRGAVGRRAARARAVRLRAAAVLAARARDRGRRAAGVRGVRDGRDPVEPARRRLALRQVPQGRARRRASTRAERIPQRYDLSLPENQRKLDAADALARLADEAGMPLVHMALAFVLQHPAVTAPIIGPRTMEQLESHLGAVDVDARRRRCSTGSTRSSRRGRTSTRPTPAGRRPRSPTRRCAAARRARRRSRTRRRRR